MAQRRYRIGELARLTDTNPELLRAWERRYGLLTPDRSPGRQRTYSDEDLAVIREMRANLERGMPAAEAARLARLQTFESGEASGAPRAVAGDLRETLEAFRDVDAQRLIDSALAMYSIEAVVRDLILPVLHALGERWSAGQITVGQEHFASNLLRGRLLGLARGWDQGGGPLAVLACPPSELHDIGLICFGLLLRERGWRIVYLGQDTPVSALAATARAEHPQAIILSAVTPHPFQAARQDLADLAQGHPILIGGAGADPPIATTLSAQALPDDIADAASVVAAQATTQPQERRKPT